MAQHILELSDETADFDRLTTPLAAQLAPGRSALSDVVVQNEGELPMRVGQDLERLRSETGLTMFCEVYSIPASSYRTGCRRLNRRGGC